MINEAILKVKEDRKLYNYLKYHSYWYNIITENPERIKDMIKEMKKELKETFEDKLSDINNKISFIRSLVELTS